MSFTSYTPRPSGASLFDLGQLDTLKRQVRNGDVILMHDDSDRAENVLKAMLPEWKSEGFSMQALPEEAA